jgi:hypothetical protein
MKKMLILDIGMDSNVYIRMDSDVDITTLPISE